MSVFQFLLKKAFGLFTFADGLKIYREYIQFFKGILGTRFGPLQLKIGSLE